MFSRLDRISKKDRPESAANSTYRQNIRENDISGRWHPPLGPEKSGHTCGHARDKFHMARRRGLEALLCSAVAEFLLATGIMCKTFPQFGPFAKPMRS